MRLDPKKFKHCVLYSKTGLFDAMFDMIRGDCFHNSRFRENKNIFYLKQTKQTLYRLNFASKIPNLAQNFRNKILTV